MTEIFLNYGIIFIKYDRNILKLWYVLIKYDINILKLWYVLIKYDINIHKLLRSKQPLLVRSMHPCLYNYNIHIYIIISPHTHTHTHLHLLPAYLWFRGLH